MYISAAVFLPSCASLLISMWLTNAISMTIAHIGSLVNDRTRRQVSPGASAVGCLGPLSWRTGEDELHNDVRTYNGWRARFVKSERKKLSII